jgi:ribosomal protein L11 methyltransferase
VEHADAALARLIELAPEGFEQVDLDGFVEFALYGAPGELPDLPRGRADLAGIPIDVSGSEVGDDWADRWRQFHKPVQIGHIHVRAPWHDPAAGIEIVVDPGQAFGTGAHPTTRMCLELLLDVSGDAREGAGGEPAGSPPPDRGPAGGPPPDRGPLADLGCGSGVLAIAAAKLGFGPITAVDHELAAVRATMENARLNGVTLDRVERLDLREEAAPVAPITVANLVRPLLLRVAELLPEQPETLIVSGLLEGEEDEVAAAFASLSERRRLRLQEWSALLLTRP